MASKLSPVAVLLQESTNFLGTENSLEYSSPIFAWEWV